MDKYFRFSCKPVLTGFAATLLTFAAFPSPANAALVVNGITYNQPAVDQTYATEIVGDNTVGTYNQAGGTNTVTNGLWLGYRVGGSGFYNLSGISVGGTSALVALYEYIGNYGPGVFTQIGGTNTVTNYISLGVTPTITGSYDLSGGILSSSSIILGDQGIGTFTHSGGTNNVRGIKLVVHA